MCFPDSAQLAVSAKLRQLTGQGQENTNFGRSQRYTYRVLQTIQMKLILFCVWADPAVLGSTKTALKFKYDI